MNNRYSHGWRKAKTSVPMDVRKLTYAKCVEKSKH